MKKTIAPFLILFLFSFIFLAFASLPEATMISIFPNFLGIFPIGFYLLALTSLLSSLVLLIFHLYRLR
jgi:hypothetical protein